MCGQCPVVSTTRNVALGMLACSQSPTAFGAMMSFRDLDNQARARSPSTHGAVVRHEGHPAEVLGDHRVGAAEVVGQLLGRPTPPRLP